MTCVGKRSLVLPTSTRAGQTARRPGPGIGRKTMLGEATRRLQGEKCCNIPHHNTAQFPPQPTFNTTPSQQYGTNRYRSPPHPHLDHLPHRVKQAPIHTRTSSKNLRAGPSVLHCSNRCRTRQAASEQRWLRRSADVMMMAEGRLPAFGFVLAFVPGEPKRAERGSVLCMDDGRWTTPWVCIAWRCMRGREATGGGGRG